MKTCPVCDTPYPDQHATCPSDGAVLIESQELPPGHLVRGKYRILRKLGQGGMGVVYLAEHLMLGGQVALKFLAAELSRNPQLIKRFRQEARAAYQLRHPNIAEVTDLDQDEEGSLFIAMEYVAGPSLRSLLEHSTGPLPLEQVLHIARGVGAGLAAAHLRGIVHRDIKPDNILLGTDSGGVMQAKVLDFGIAAITEGITNLSQTRGLLLTPDYAAPEQWRGMLAAEMDGRTDLYALGGVFYEMLTGRTPYQAQTMEGWMYQHLQGTPEPLLNLRPSLVHEQAGLEGIVMRLLAREREQRFPSAEAFLEAIAPRQSTPHPSTLVESLPVLRPPTVVEKQPKPDRPAPAGEPVLESAPPPSPRRTRTATWAAVALIGIAAAGAIGIAVSRSSRPATAVPVLSPAGGAYAEAQPVSIFDATPNATVYYTVDGKSPSEASPIYTQPIAALPNGAMVRAMARAEGHAPSAEVAGLYVWSAGASSAANSRTIPGPQPATPGATGKDKTDIVPPAKPLVAPVNVPAPELTAEELRAKAYVLTGVERMKARDYVSAENNFQMALNLDPGNAAAKGGLAAAKKALGE